MPQPPERSPRSPVWGRDFPDGVIALTWDDGPDVGTLELARYLRTSKISATFFVVGDWVEGISDEPGFGRAIHETGYERRPVLGELVRMGHRLGSHTQNHALLGGATAAIVTSQLKQGFSAIEPFVGNELRIFRPPGGSWTDASAAALTDPFFTDVVGPVLWDFDAKDWDASLYCRQSPAADCEPGPIPGQSRVRANVIARRYLDQIGATRHGIVLLHDRVGDVGSRYALDVARHLIPSLATSGFVFAAPVLRFSELRERLSFPDPARTDLVTFADVDGDGHSDFCRATATALLCARVRERANFDPPRVVASMATEVFAIDGGDIDGDGRADLCASTSEGIRCTTFERSGKVANWATDLAHVRRSFHLADVDGDGRADACTRTDRGIACAKSNGRSFGGPELWLSTMSPKDGDFELADLDGDRRADVCLRSARGVSCALSTGHGFGHASTWSTEGDFADERAMVLADLNGDGRADACSPSPSGVSCALSNGHAFKHATIWSPSHATELHPTDLNGDGRADVCTVTDTGLACGLAP